MPRLVPMGDLIERCQNRADKANDDHIANAEWRSLISEVYGSDVYSPVAETGLRYFEFTSTLTTTGAAYVSEPSDTLSVVRLDYIVNAVTGERRDLRRIQIGEQSRYAGQTGSEAREWALVDDRIYLYPTPPTGQTYELLYIPQSPDLSTFDDDDCVDVVSSDGESCLIWGVAGLAKAKASQDSTLFIQKQELYRSRLVGWAANRHSSDLARRVVTDDYTLDDLLPGDRRLDR